MPRCKNVVVDLPILICPYKLGRGRLIRGEYVGNSWIIDNDTADVVIILKVSSFGLKHGIGNVRDLSINLISATAQTINRGDSRIVQRSFLR